MAHFLRLILLASVGLLLAPAAQAQTYAYCINDPGQICRNSLPEWIGYVPSWAGGGNYSVTGYSNASGASGTLIINNGQVGGITWQRIEVAPSPCASLQGTSYEAWNYTGSWPPSSSGCASSSECAITMEVLSKPYAAGEGVIAYRMKATYTGSSCSLEPPTDEAGSDDAGDGWTCDPNTGLCTDPNGQGKLCSFNPDGSRSACVDYAPGNGSDPSPTEDDKPEDPRDKQTASGGGTCTQAPACTSKNPIECAMLWQQWKTRCALEKEGTVSGAGCTNGVPTTLNCTNMDAGRCFQLQKQHETACYLGVSGDSEDGIDWGSADQSLGEFTGSGQGWADGNGGNGDGSGPSTPELDDSGFLGGSRSCPTLPQVNVFGTVLDFDLGPFCGFLAIGSNLVLLFAALAAGRIIGGAI